MSGAFYWIFVITLILLKCYEKLDWSWFWVLAPILLPLVLVAVGFVLIVIARGCDENERT